MNQCIVNHPGCEGLTNGSVGAAGYVWPMICQPCKDVEDGALSVSLGIQVYCNKVAGLITEVPQ
jgi:hypothetical protein